MRRSKKVKKVHEAEDGTRFRSGFEHTVYKDISSRIDGGVQYETIKIAYSTNHNYTPDLILPNGIIIEIKGRFTSSDRSKHVRIRETHGDSYKIRFVFQRAKITISKVSTTTYGDWCDKHGFLWCEKIIPDEWLV